MHLLMETAIGDSQQYEVLSFEEVDELKREHFLLSNRIDATKRKLVLESKLRDAAQSLNRLYSPKPRDSGSDASPMSSVRHRRSFRSSKSSNNDLLSKTDDEMTASTAKCDELAQELWKLETRAQELQRRLLEHTAGVLQLTHKGYLRPDPKQHPDGVQGYSVGLDSPPMTGGAYEFDDRSFYQTLGPLDDFGGGQRGGQGDRESFTRPKSPSGGLTSNPQFMLQNQAIEETERRLEDLNTRLRDLISQTSPQNQQIPPPRSERLHNEENPEGSLYEQLDYLEKGLETIRGDREAIVHDAERSAYATEDRVGALNSRLRGIIALGGEGRASQYPPPPEVSGQDLQGQLDYLEGALGKVEQDVRHIIDEGNALSSRSVGHEEKAQRYDTVLLGLWGIVVAGEEEARKQNQEQRAVGANNSSAPDEAFSLQAFSAKVQSLYARATGLQEQKDILTRQVQQQRELNSTSDAQKDAQLSSLTMELQHKNNDLEALSREAKSNKDELMLAKERLDTARQESNTREQQRNIEGSNALQIEKEARREAEEHMFAELQAKQDQILAIEAELVELKDDFRIADVESEGRLEQSKKHIQMLTGRLEAAEETKSSMDANEASLRQLVETKTHEAEMGHNALKELEAEILALRTEVTVTRAELDGAYGTRAQRAAEVAPDPALQKEFDELSQRNASLLEEIANLKATYDSAGSGNAKMAHRVEMLQNELNDTIGEYEIMTKASIDFEKEREQLENMVDRLRDQCESLEGQLGDEKVRWLGMSPSGGRDSLVPGNTSTMVLKNEFKKMMRETRAENMKALRVSTLLLLYFCEDPDTANSSSKKSVVNSKPLYVL